MARFVRVQVPPKAYNQSAKGSGFLIVRAVGARSVVIISAESPAEIVE